MSARAPDPTERLFAQLLSLQSQVRAATSSSNLAYCLVNDAQTLFGFRHAALLIAGRTRAVTGISQVEPHAPFVAFVERGARELMARGISDQPQRVDMASMSEAVRTDCQSLSANAVFWLPLLERGKIPFGGLWIAREQPWSDAEQALLTQLGDCYSHAWLALEPKKPWRLRWPRRKFLALAISVVLLLAIPVRQSVLAPAEVVPLNGTVVTAPLDGVIAEFLVRPNQPVRRGKPLLRFDATSLRAQADVAERSLDVAQAELRSNAQRAFSDSDAKARLDLLAARVEQKRAERDYALALLARSEVRADRDGIAVFADADRWTGKPVQTGERLLDIADPVQAELRIELAVADAIALAPGAEVALFLDSDPLNRHPARLQHLAYEAQASTAGQLAYRLDARFSDAPPRIGLRGTAKLYGQPVPLVLYLLRRPLAAVRQGLGF
ncbi:efflux RND transporter periplasmic adaptor subunit [Marinobacterium rhizophilum]|uniref:HlyD family efflux transporter periplasmic adaptor subunit n=1 Tax=Marinobacterium rhizophilum TaxID=420402 RepID=A0ABY5HLE7_9GAMM|nr:HlyD family efflux transporter periplasmic adaptor subunit [Marinobacterium rhizophilum]UTW13135.1 HlyD family efflux transporter periplasmic adaptor subunit [Marinobacterium rhizophilum]